jgi:hypothetical protein
MCLLPLVKLVFRPGLSLENCCTHKASNIAQVVGQFLTGSLCLDCTPCTKIVTLVAVHTKKKRNFATSALCLMSLVERAHNLSFTLGIGSEDPSRCSELVGFCCF